jgi:hypothetical protein
LNADRAPQLKAIVSRLSFREAMKLLGSISIAFLLLLAAFGQVVDRPRVFDPIPVAQRVQLAERLKLLVECKRTKEYEKMFEMLSKVHTQHPELTREQFLAAIRVQGRAHIVDFVPEYTTTNSTIDGEYAIYGCAKCATSGARRNGKRLLMHRWRMANGISLTFFLHLLVCTPRAQHLVWRRKSTDGRVLRLVVRRPTSACSGLAGERPLFVVPWASR